MKRLLLTVTLVAMVGLAGCASFTGGQAEQSPTANTDGDRLAVADDSTDATAVNQTLRLTVNETTAGSELFEVGATYPRDRFTGGSAQHERIALGVDTDGDGQVDHEFDETHVSGVNNNAYSFDITLETGYTLEAGDVVVVGYPAVDNPSEPGEYEVELRLNDQRTTGIVTIE